MFQIIPQILSFSHSPVFQAIPSISSSPITACHMCSQYIVVLSFDLHTSSSSRGAKGSTIFQTPAWKMMQGSDNYLNRPLTSSMALRMVLIDPGTAPSLQTQGSAYILSFWLYFVPLSNLSFISLILGQMHPTNLPNFLANHICSDKFLIAGASKIIPAYFYGFFTAILKETVPPQLLPERQTFGFDFSLFKMKSIKDSTCLIVSSKDLIYPLYGPSD